MAKKEAKVSKPKVDVDIKSLQEEVMNLNEMIVAHAKKISKLEFIIKNLEGTIEDHKALVSTMRGRLGV